jgi:peptidoglycan hydrolase-like protein with peptidoglycan-binding domain
MEALKKESKGKTVVAWQYFLIGQGYSKIVADGDFGKNTHDATLDFQRKHKLLADGVVGNDTFLVAMKLGFQLVVNDADAAKDGPNWPTAPDFKPLSPSQIINMFGKFDYKIMPDKSTVQILGDWAAKNIVSIEIPQIKGLPPYNVKKISVHTKVANQFVKLFNEWEKAKLIPQIKTFDGSFNPRLVRGSNSVLSNHTFGIAIDINVPWNKLGAIPATKGQEGCIRELIPIANKLGFYWGGHFSRKDGMHFEVAKII